ncbi:hypothetical protein HMPREF0004_5554 [Achromobacter piechaudii ATCC 43553]|uniref:Uncharacterized protein n=1 Tax=Achromobacter piechaudii ATCC 43553 TaxID=742159 RepID=D4XJA7_9BURK|nr:hypothetical protein HMPREF0004_5554 [Achromobacter piechaudii ATCC 43553]
MNLVDRAKVLQGIAEVRQGLTFCLSLPLDVPGGMALNPRRLPPQRYATLRDGKSAGAQGFCWSYASEDPLLTDVVCDDVLLMNTQYSTQWDSLAHMGSSFDADGDGAAEAVFYNGFRAGVDVLAADEDPHALADWARFPGPSAGALGIDHLAEHGVQGRAVMIDLEAHVGRTRTAVGYDQLMRILEADDVAVEAGDMVCLHNRLWRHADGDEPPARRRAPACHRQRPGRRRPTPAAMDRRLAPGLPHCRQPRGRIGAAGRPGRRGDAPPPPAPAAA